MLSIALGPLSLPVAVLLLMASVIGGLFVAGVLARRSAGKASDPLLLVLFGALLVGRLVFVIRFADSYSSFWQMLDFRDRGIDTGAAVLAALMLLIVQLKRYALLKTAMFAGAATTAASLLLGSWWLYSQQQHQSLADIQLDSLSGYQVTLTQLAQDKPVVLNLWASWCPPCHREMPVLLSAQQQYADISIIMVNLQENRDTVLQYLRQHQLTFAQMLLDYRGDVASYYGAQGVPATLFFRADGKLADAHFGELSNARLRQGIEKARSKITAQ